MKDYSYRYVKAWGVVQGIHDNKIMETVEQALLDDAPEDALYKGEDGTWVRFKDLTNQDTIVMIKTILHI